MRNKTRLLSLLLALIMALGLWGCGEEHIPPEPHQTGADNIDEGEELLDEDGSYTTRDDVALYLWQYGCLPANFITKSEARDLGWPGGSLEPYAEGKCIGGDAFGNREGSLPEGDRYYECDVNTLGADERGAERLVYTEDVSRIYYTGDHYETFELLHGQEDE